MVPEPPAKLQDLKPGVAEAVVDEEQEGTRAMQEKCTVTKEEIEESKMEEEEGRARSELVGVAAVARVNGSALNGPVDEQTQLEVGGPQVDEVVGRGQRI